MMFLDIKYYVEFLWLYLFNMLVRLIMLEKKLSSGFNEDNVIKIVIKLVRFWAIFKLGVVIF